MNRHWFGWRVPGLPADLATLNAAVVSALAQTTLTQLLRLGSGVCLHAAQFADFWVSEVKRYADVVRLSNNPR